MASRDPLRSRKLNITIFTFRILFEFTLLKHYDNNRVHNVIAVLIAMYFIIIVIVIINVAGEFCKIGGLRNI